MLLRMINHPRVRLTFGLLLACLASYAAWGLGQSIERLLNGFWEWQPKVWFEVPILFLAIQLVLFLPGVLVSERVASTRFYACLGAIIYLAMYLMIDALLLWALIDDQMERADSGQEMSTGEILATFVRVLASEAIRPTGGLYALAIGAAGGFAFGIFVNNTRPQSNAGGHCVDP